MTTPHAATSTAISPDVDAVDLFARVQQAFEDVVEVKRLVAASELRALFVVRDAVLRREVSLRVHLQPNTASRTWFERETETLAALDHPALRAVYSAGYNGDWAYRITKWIEGESLADAASRAPRPIPRVVRLVQDLTSLLGYVHSHGIVIRRIVPTTVMIETTGRIFVIDMRHASSLLDVGTDDWSDDTLAFLAPEVREGEAGTPSSDIYTAGALLYYAMTAQYPPLDTTSITPPRELRPTCPVAIERIILRSLKPIPSDRYLTASELADDLFAMLGDFEVDIPEAPPLGLVTEDSRKWEIRLRRALGDKYELLSELGAGAFGRVYGVRDLALEREVALKVLHPFLTADPAVVERFRKEAQLAARIMHPHIVNTYDIGGRVGLLWYTMEYVPGRNLAQAVAADGPLSVDQVLRLLSETLDALQYAHSFRLVHRDLKPENILLHDATGRSLITDFGLAIALHGHNPFAGATSRSGTPEFAAPEQLLGEQVDHRTDIYSLGTCAYYALTGESPFGGGSVTTIIARQTSQSLPSLEAVRRDVPQELAQALQRATAQSPDDRFQSADEFRAAISEARRPPRFAWLRFGSRTN